MMQRVIPLRPDKSGTPESRCRFWFLYFFSEFLSESWSKFIRGNAGAGIYNWLSPSTYSSRKMCSPSNTT